MDSEVTTFQDVLQALSSEAKDRLTLCLSSLRNLKAARLACRSLRDTVDSSLRRAFLEIRQNDEELLELPSKPPLHRWFRCIDVFIWSCYKTQFSTAFLSKLLASLYLGAPQAARCNVTCLTLNIPLNQPGTGSGLSLLLHSLPSLRKVKLRQDLPPSRAEQRLVFQGLASLTGLLELRLPSGRAINDVHMLAGSLRRLELYPPCEGHAFMFDTTTAASVARLHALEELCVCCVRDIDTLAHVLRGLPPSLRKLSLDCCEAFHLSPDVYNARLACEVQDGCVSSIYGELKFGYMDWGPLVQLAAADGELLRRLRSMRLNSLSYGEQGLGPGAQAAAGAALLRGLWQHGICMEGWFGRGAVYIEDANMPPDLVLDYLSVVHGSYALYLRLGNPDEEPHPYTWRRYLKLCLEHGLRSLSGAAAATGSSLLSLTPSLASLTIQELTSVHGRCTTQTTAARILAASSNDGGGDDVSASSPLLLLRGPLLSAVAADPGALRDFMRQLLNSARAAELSYMPLPGADAAAAGAVLVGCGSAAGAAAVEAAVSAAAVSAGLPAGLEDSVAQIEALPALATRHVGWKPAICPRVGFHMALEKVAQRLLDGGGPGGGGSAWQRLRWVLEQWADVRSLPARAYKLSA